MVFENFLYNLFPPYFHETDTYKVSGNGIWKRFLSIFGREVDDYVYNKIEGLADLRDLDQDKFIRHLAFILGNIPQGNFDNDIYKAFLKEATYLYKIKGTKESYIRLFKLINQNYEVTITEHFSGCSRRDSEPDRDNPNALRDICCAPCQEYSVSIFNDSPVVEPNALAKINWAITILEPINAKLRTLEYVEASLLTEYLAAKIEAGGGTAGDLSCVKTYINRNFTDIEIPQQATDELGINLNENINVTLDGSPI